MRFPRLTAEETGRCPIWSLTALHHITRLAGSTRFLTTTILTTPDLRASSPSKPREVTIRSKALSLTTSRGPQDLAITTTSRLSRGTEGSYSNMCFDSFNEMFCFRFDYFRSSLIFDDEKGIFKLFGGHLTSCYGK